MGQLLSMSRELLCELLLTMHQLDNALMKLIGRRAGHDHTADSAINEYQQAIATPRYLRAMATCSISASTSMSRLASIL